MKIRIPDRVAVAYDRWADWVNVEVYKRVRRIDIVLAIGFIGCVAWYGYTTGWRGALLGGVMYAVMAAVALWIL